jgi:hypothetical protein
MTVRPVSSGQVATLRMPSGVSVTPTRLRNTLIGMDVATTSKAAASRTAKPAMR